MISNAPFAPPVTSTISDRREHRMLAEWRREHAAAHRTGRSARRSRSQLRLRLRTNA